LIRPNFLSHLKLSQKGLLLVGLLLSLELLFVGSLGWLLYEAERESSREAHSKAILGKTQRILQLLYEASDNLKEYCTSRDPAAATTYDQAVKEVPATLAWLKTALKDNKEDLKLVDNMDNLVKDGLAILNVARQRIEVLPPNLAERIRQRAKDQTSPLFKEMVPNWLALVRSQKQIALESPEVQQRNRQYVKAVVVIGLCLNVMLALVLGLIFARSITARLQVLVDNTQRLKNRQPLNPVLPGDDEIVYLDKAFHQMADDLEEVQKLRQAFVAMVSHELKTPLTSVRAYLELLGMGALGEISPQAKQDAYAAEQNVLRLIKLINELLDLEKLEVTGFTVDLKPCPLEQVLKSAYESVKDFAQARQVTIKITPTDLTVMADQDRMIQVVVNLLSNAVKYSPQNSPVTVSVQTTPIDHQTMAEIRITDQGKGIPPKYQEVIFERFQQVEPGDSQMGGTGLGLSITKTIVEKHGGTIGVESQEGKGSTFWFRLPLNTGGV
jgi:signal transduction histidine kinase